MNNASDKSLRIDRTVDKSLMRVVTTLYNRSLVTAFRSAAKNKSLSAFNPDAAKLRARGWIIDQVNDALDLLDSGNAAA